MQQLNLYNAAFENKRELLSLPGLAVAWGGAIVLVVAVLVVMGMRTSDVEQQLARDSSERTTAQAQLTQLTTQVAARKLNPTLAEELANLDADLASRKQVMRTLGDGLIGDTKGFSEHLKAFARQSFDGLWLTGLSMTNAGRDIVVEGRTLAPDSVPGYVQRLNRELVMRGHAFSDLQMSRPEEKSADKAESSPAFIEFRLATVAQQVSTGARN